MWTICGRWRGLLLVALSVFLWGADVLLVGAGIRTVRANSGGGLEISITGPAQSTTGTTVSYTVKLTGTLADTSYVAYRPPPGFSVQETTPNGSKTPSGVWIWNANLLGPDATITITGTHSVASGCVAVHQVWVDDTYSTGVVLAADQAGTQLTDVLCVYLPTIMKE
ncbi:MAG: hypothetical protein Q9O62_01215 [Ardenticatenia bacterium]|nr:hypothetical protein [Ardenticatenia bacterium]